MWTGSEAEITITLYLIRHGATPSNKRHAYLGKTDEALSDEGRKQILTYKEEDVYPRISNDLLVMSGPMLRCLQTKELIYPDSKEIVIPEWTEIDFGRFEGKNYQELNGDPDYQRWIDSGGMLAFPDGESREKFIKRSLIGFNRCLEQVVRCKKDQAVCVVHGGTIMAVVSSLTGGDYYDYQVKNGQGYQWVLMVKDRNVQIKKVTALQ